MVLLHSLVDVQSLQSDAFGWLIYIVVSIKVDISGATAAFMEHCFACIVGVGNLREASKG